MWEANRAYWAGLLFVGSSVSLGCSGGSEPPREVPAATTRAAIRTLEGAYPNARVESHGTRISRIFGASLAAGATPVAAADRFRAAHERALGLAAGELVPQTLTASGVPIAAQSPAPIGLMFDPQRGTYKFWLYRYGQVKGGLAVHGATLLALVRNDGSNPVVWASSSVRDLGSFAPPAGARAPAPDLTKALAALRGQEDFTGQPIGPSSRVTSASPPNLLVFAGTETADSPPRLAIEFEIETAAPAGRYRIVADAQTGDVLHQESLILFADVTGTVTGNVTEGIKSMECSPEAGHDFALAEVTAPGTSAFTDPSGAFTLPNPGTAPITVTSPVGGQHFDVFTVAGSADTLSQSVTPPGPANFVHNAANTDPLTVAQANGYVHSVQIRDFLLGYLPDYPTISTQTNFAVYVNRSDMYCPGNAWYSPGIPSINFCLASTTHGNTAFAGITQHEFGHHIVQMGGSGQGPYGEGMSDTIAVLYAQDPGLGYGFYLNQCSSPLRTADNDCQYSPSACSSCGSASHACGNLLSGSIWSVREQLAVTEPETHESLLSALVLSSIPMHTGTGIGPSIAVDLLTLDDDDGELANGSPHYAEICAGFAEHGIACPPLLTGLSVTPSTGLVAEGPTGGPFTPGSVSYTLTNLGPSAALAYQVAPTPSAPWLSLTNASGSLGLNEQVEVTVAIDQAVAAGLPDGAYDTTLQFSNLSAGGGNSTRTAHLEVGAPPAIFTETFEGGLGAFTVGTETGNLWHRSTACLTTLPGHSTPGSLYFGIDSSCNFANGTRVTGTATSSSIPITDTSVVKLRFNYLVATENAGSWDQASVSVSVNGGPFQVVASNNQGGVQLVDGATWKQAEVNLSPLLSGLSSATAQLRVSFDSVDGAINDSAGFIIDDVALHAFTGGCDANEECNDGLFCNGTETCFGGSCLPGVPVVCSDSVSCTQDSCDESTDQCVFTPQNSACSDGEACNGVEVCSATSGCQPGTPLDCDDGSVCTTDACDSVLGCTHTPITCNDGNVCTDDSCNPATGCQFTNNTSACADDGNSCTTDVCSAGVCTHPQIPSCGGTGPFLESGGQVVIEAEHFTNRIGRAGHSWEIANNGSASGGQEMSCNPNNNANQNTGYVTGAPQLDFSITFTTTGTYHVWLRGSGATQDDDSVHAGIDGTGPVSADRITGFGAGLGWSKSTMDNVVATIVVSTPGTHTFHLWMREDGFRVDKILLTTNAGFTPSGAGPAESPRGPGGGGSSPCASYCQNPVSFSGNFQSGNLGTGATCYQTTGNVNGGNCGNFQNPRALFVNGTQMTCNHQNWSSLPAKVNGGYCVYTTAGNHPWAYFTTW